MSGLPIEQAWSLWAEAAAGAARRLQLASVELTETFRRVAQQSSARATQADDTTLRRELIRPPLDIDALLGRLAAEGAGALSRRERKALLSSPDRMTATALRDLLGSAPELAAHAMRVCFTHWSRYVSEPWGADYQFAILSSPRTARGVLRVDVPLRSLLARAVPDGAEFLAGLLPQADVAHAYQHLRNVIGVRDTWLFSSSTLAAWLHAKAREERAPLDSHVRAVLGDVRLSALLLPAARNAIDTPPVRSSVAVQARVIVTALDCAFSSQPRLGGSTLSALVTRLLASTFLDPRDALRSQGWTEVSRLNEQAFRQLLATLCEQDLDVFFQHAMNEPDRRRFWLRYLPELERTGCVLDRDVRDSLKAKLHGMAEVQGAIERAYAFSHASGVQAFLLVFANIVVIEFSDTGNAAYVYSREFFSKSIEPRLRKGQLDNHVALKRKAEAKHRIRHAGRWQEAADDWLASEGVHARWEHSK